MTNLMPYSSFEAGTIPVSFSNTITRTTTRSYVGGSSLTQTLTAATGNWSDGAPANNDRWVNVTVAVTYTISAYVWTTAAASANIGIEWYTSGPAYISTTTGTTTGLTVGGWTRLTATGAAPSTAATGHGVFNISGSSSGTALFYDAMQFEAASSASPWDPGPGDPTGGRLRAVRQAVNRAAVI